MDFVGGIISLSVGAVLVETLTEYIVMVIPKLPWYVKMIISMIIGVGLSLVFGFDLTTYVGLTTQIPYVSLVITGIILSRGSNFLHDLLKRFTAVKEEVKELVADLNDDPNVIHAPLELEGK